MQDIHSIRRRIRAISQTRKLTGALYLVSSVRVRNEVKRMEYNKKYFLRLQSAMDDLLAGSQGISHPFLEPPKGERKTFIIISSDSGMVGPYNSGVFRLAQHQLEESPEHKVIAIGKRTELFCRNRGISCLQSFPCPSGTTQLHHVRHLMEDLVDMFISGETDSIHMIYTSYFGDSRNLPTVCRLLPLELEHPSQTACAPKNIIYNPTPSELFDQLVPLYLESYLYGLFTQARASENFSRMTAMQKATENADSLLQKMQVQYSMARQSAITQEITEISGAAEALLSEGALQ